MAGEGSIPTEVTEFHEGIHLLMFLFMAQVSDPEIRPFRTADLAQKVTINTWLRSSGVASVAYYRSMTVAHE